MYVCSPLAILQGTYIMWTVPKGARNSQRLGVRKIDSRELVLLQYLLFIYSLYPHHLVRNQTQITTSTFSRPVHSRVFQYYWYTSAPPITLD